MAHYPLISVDTYVSLQTVNTDLGRSNIRNLKFWALLNGTVGLDGSAEGW